MKTEKRNRVVDLLHRMMQIDKGHCSVVMSVYPFVIHEEDEWYTIEETLMTVFLGWDTPTKEQQEFVDLLDIVAGLFYRSTVEGVRRRITFAWYPADSCCRVSFSNSDNNGILDLHWDMRHNEITTTWFHRRVDSVLFSYRMQPSLLRELCGGSILDKAVATCGQFYDQLPLCTGSMIAEYNSIMDEYICDDSERRHGQYGLLETLMKVSGLDPNTFVLSRKLECYDDETGELKHLTASEGNVFLIEF